MDQITQSMMDSFKRNFELNIKDETLVFEHFVNYYTVTNEWGLDNFDIEDITTGKATQGIDGIAIIVNNKIVNTTEEIDHLLEQNQYLSVKFVFIQSKTSDSIDNTQISGFFSFTNIFFSNDTTIFVTPEMKKFIELKNHIFLLGSKLKENPKIILYYAYQGKWVEDKNLRKIINLEIQNLEKPNHFSDIKFTPCDSEMIQSMYRKATSKLSTVFIFEKRITMYSKDNDVGYSGVLPFKEYKKLILDDNGIQKPVFEDNIRDYLGPNLDVNKSITTTVKEGNENSFCMLNNGITIVASSINIMGDTATIEDYQIVNGCQTTHVLIDIYNSNIDIDNLIIPIRIIATKDEAIKSNITRATNSQTAIKKEQLEALSTLQKKIEEFYKTYTDKDSLKYERRIGQYRGNDIAKNRIISIPTQIKAIAAMFLNEPSAVSGQYGTVVKRIGHKIFKHDDNLLMYYVSALALYRIESLFRNNVLDKTYYRCRYHAIMLLRIVTEKISLPKKFNNKKMESYCENIFKILNDNTKYEKYFSAIVAFIVSKDLEITISDRKCFEKKETTEFFIKNVDELKIFVKIYQGAPT